MIGIEIATGDYSDSDNNICRWLLSCSYDGYGAFDSFGYSFCVGLANAEALDEIFEIGPLARLIKKICHDDPRQPRLRALYQCLKSTPTLITGRCAMVVGLDIVKEGLLGAQFKASDDSCLITSPVADADLSEVKDARIEFEGIPWHEFASVILGALDFRPEQVRGTHDSKIFVWAHQISNRTHLHPFTSPK